MQLGLENRSTVVTGATGELGLAVAEALLAEGARCHLPCRSAAKLAQLAERHGDRVRIAEGVDPTDEGSVERFYASVPRLWASVHCVGAFGMSPIAASRLAELESLFTANAVSAYLCSREAVKQMRASNAGGRIVNVSSRLALEPRTGSGAVAYAMAKAAVSALTQALAAEVASEGILVNAVAPSILDTPVNRAAMPKAEHGAWPKLDEVAAAIAFLVSPAQSTVQGALVTAYGRI